MTHRPHFNLLCACSWPRFDPRARAPQQTHQAPAPRTTHRAPRRVEPGPVSARDSASHEKGHVKPRRHSMLSNLLHRITGQLAGANADADADADPSDANADVRFRFPPPLRQTPGNQVAFPPCLPLPYPTPPCFTSSCPSCATPPHVPPPPTIRC
jgi:hypothetical protein